MSVPGLQIDGQIQVMELFGPTIQGEGIMSGTLTHFLRTGGCALRCSWCDSFLAIDPKLILEHRTLMAPSQSIAAVQGLPWAPYITFTGGDPAIQQRLGDLIPAINWLGTRVAVETQGMYFPEWFDNCDVLTFSPKGPSSGNIVPISGLQKYLISLGSRRKQQICIKVVVFNQDDFNYAMDVYLGIPEIYYDAFYFTAGTPLNDVPIEDIEDEHERLAASQQKVLDVVHNQTQLSDMLLKEARTVKFNHKVHVGCQQHVLLWPSKEKGV